MWSSVCFAALFSRDRSSVGGNNNPLSIDAEAPKYVWRGYQSAYQPCCGLCVGSSQCSRRLRGVSLFGLCDRERSVGVDRMMIFFEVFWNIFNRNHLAVGTVLTMSLWQGSKLSPFAGLKAPCKIYFQLALKSNSRSCLRAEWEKKGDPRCIPYTSLSSALPFKHAQMMSGTTVQLDGLSQSR